MARTFTYRFEDEFELSVPEMRASDLSFLESIHGKCTYNGWAEFMGVGRPSNIAIIGGANTRGDGFKSGWHPGLNMHIGGPEHYSKVLKEKNLVEVGNERQKDSDYKAPKKSYIGEEIVKEAIAAGAEIGTEAAEALISGKSITESTIEVRSE